MFDVQVPENDTTFEKTVEGRAADIGLLVDNIRNNLHLETKKRQIQLLTIPASLNWPRQKLNILSKFLIILHGNRDL